MITVRKAVVSDAEVMASTEKKYLNCPWTASQIADEIQSNGVVFVTAEVNGEYAGHLSGRIVEDECDVSNIVVDERFRRMGVAQALFGLFFESVRGMGAWDIYLTVRVNNTPAVSLYQKIGFTPLGKRKGYYKGIDGIIMRKALEPPV